MKLKAISLTAITLCTLGMNSVLADDDWGWSRRGPDVAPVKNELYQNECGSCHFAYQPSLLPAASWEKIMGGLTDHFGENAELLEDTRTELTDYLVTNAADNVDGYRRSAKILRSLRGETPLRISETPYIRNKHDEIPARVFRTNTELRSLSNCAACHTRADSGSFAEREIDIPGFGRWEDD